MSTPMAEAAPSSREAMDRMPEPQPRSSTLAPGFTDCSVHSRHSRVEAWLPVPKVRPGLR